MRHGFWSQHLPCRRSLCEHEPMRVDELAAAQRAKAEQDRHRQQPDVLAAAREVLREGPKLNGSIGEGPNHSTFSDQSSVKILSE